MAEKEKTEKEKAEKGVFNEMGEWKMNEKCWEWDGLLDIVGPAVLVLRRLPAEGEAGAPAVPGGLWGQPAGRARHVAGGAWLN